MKRDTAATPRLETAPPLSEASASLARRTGAVYMSLLIRAVAVGVLWAILAARLPFLARNQAVLDAIGAVLVVAPFFTAMGKLYAWRIALGRAYLRENRASDAASALAPFDTLRARLFDATGEGAFHLVLARRGVSSDDNATHLLTRVASRGQTPWCEQAGALLGNAANAAAPHSSTESPATP